MFLGTITVSIPKLDNVSITSGVAAKKYSPEKVILPVLISWEKSNPLRKKVLPSERLLLSLIYHPCEYLNHAKRFVWTLVSFSNIPWEFQVTSVTRKVFIV